MKIKQTYFLEVSFLFGLILCFVMPIHAQIGGKNAFQFLQLPASAHVAGVGSENVSLKDKSSGFVWSNPALLSDTMHKEVLVTVHPYYAGIFHSHVQYSTRIKNSGMWSAGLSYFSYGKMDQTLSDGTVIGTFNPKDFALYVAKSHQVGLFSVGGSLKFVGSQVVDYSAYAVALDAGAVFHHPRHDWTIGFAIKNFGFPLKSYTQEVDVNTPFDIQLGTTFKPEHLPVRFSLTAQKLYQYDISYYDPSLNKSNSFSGTNAASKEDNFFLKGFRHAVIGAEVMLMKNFHVRLGYNALIRRELRLESKSGGAGLSWGFMLRIKRFDFSFTRAYYHVAGATSYVTLQLNANELFKKTK